MHTISRSAARRALLFVLAGLFAGTAWAQGITNSAISGRVVDEAGEPLPGANVVAVHEPTGTQYGTTTRIDGQFDLLNARTGGPYTVTASFVGFQTTQETGINLTLGQTRELDFVLAESAVELAEVQVIGERSNVLNSERTGASTNVTEQTIERMPTIQRSLADFARLAPQSASAGDGTSFAGRNNRYNNIQIDGATLNDVFGLADTGAPGGQANAQPISLDAIQEFNVDIAPYDVRYSGFTGGQINAITRSGSNRFTGSVYYLGRNESFVGDLREEAFRDGQVVTEDVAFPDFSESFVGARFGGPIIEDKLFFFVNGEVKRRNDPLSTGLAGSNAAEIFPVAPSTIQEIVSIAQNQYGFDPGDFSPFTQNEDDTKLLAKLDWNVAQNHRLTLRHNYVDAARDRGVARYPREFTLQNSQYTFGSTQNSSVAQLTSTFGTNVYNEARLVYTRIRDQRELNGAPFPEVTIKVSDDQDVVLGQERFSQANKLDQDIWEFTNDFSYVAGNHNLTIGTSNQIFQFSNLFIQDFFGMYEFDSIEDFAAGTPSLYRYSYSRLSDPKPMAEWTGIQLGFYAQDQISVMPTLTVTAGLRVDVPFFPDEPLSNPLAEQAFGMGTTNTASGNMLWSPRLGFNWDASQGARTTQLRGGIGIFSGRTPGVWISNQYSNTGVDFARVDVRGDDVPAFSADPYDQPRLEGDPTTEINLIDESFTFPQVLRTNLALDQQLPWGMIGTLEGLYSKSINEVVFTNLNLEQTGTSAYGRPLYGDATGYRGFPSRVSDDFTNALLLENASDGYEYNLTGMVQKQSDLGLEGSVAYTFTRAENVNNGTSSRAISNWQYNENVDVNNPRIGTADFEVRHRILADVAYRLDWGDRFASTLALIYEGRSGSPFSWIYVGDANADGQSFNDLVYVPSGADDVIFKDEDGSWEELNRFIASEEGLDDYRGDFAPRNSSRAPWRNRLDLAFTQDIQTFGGQRVQLTANLFNVLNLLNPDWGNVYYRTYDNMAIWDFEGYAEDGRPIIEFDDGELDQIRDDRQDELFQKSDLASRWQLQLGIRYTF